MKNNKKNASRVRTPWDSLNDRTPSESFIRDTHIQKYKNCHPSLKDSGESTYVNNLIPKDCPYCGSTKFKANGYCNNGIHRYKCKSCGRSFNVLTGTMFQDRKLPISEWFEFWRNLFQYESFTADSWNNRNAYTTTKYWFKKTCAVLKDYQKNIVLKGSVYYDETLVSVRNDEIIRKPNGDKPRGSSKNQIFVGTATDTEKICAFILCRGEPTQNMICDVFADHIEEQSTLITDKHPGHRKLVKANNLVNIEYDGNDLKKLKDEDNPLDPINKVHKYLKLFLQTHSGFNRDDLEDYLNLFVFMMNTPVNPLEKVEILLNRVVYHREKLKYRDYYRKK